MAHRTESILLSDFEERAFPEKTLAVELYDELVLHGNEIGFSWFEIKLWLELLHEVFKVIQLFVEKLCRISSYFGVRKKAEVLDAV